MFTARYGLGLCMSVFTARYGLGLCMSVFTARYGLGICISVFTARYGLGLCMSVFMRGTDWVFIRNKFNLGFKRPVSWLRLLVGGLSSPWPEVDPT